MKNLSLSEIRRELNKISVESKDYWKVLVLGALENYMEVGKVYEITESDINNVVDNIFNNEIIMEIIDEQISNELFRFEKDKDIMYQSIMQKMEEDLENTKTKILENQDRDRLDSLAYELSTKLKIVEDIKDENIYIEDFLQELSNLENPLQVMYNKFLGMIVREDSIISTETIYDILNKI